jgi:hypothetical protein
LFSVTLYICNFYYRPYLHIFILNIKLDSPRYLKNSATLQQSALNTIFGNYNKVIIEAGSVRSGCVEADEEGADIGSAGSLPDSCGGVGVCGVA